MPIMTIGRMTINNAPKAYYAFSQGSANRYRIKGNTINDQLDTMNLMANDMQIYGFEGRIGAYMDLNGFTGDVVYNELFGVTDRMTFDGAQVFTCGAGDFLTDVLDLVGEAFAALLAL